MSPAPPGGGRPGTGRVAASGLGVLGAAVRVPFTGRARREILFCLAGLPFGLLNPVTVFIVTVELLFLTHRPPWQAGANPSWWTVLAAAGTAGLMLLVLVVTGAARRLGGGCRALAALLPGTLVAAPPPLCRRPGVFAWLAAGARDGPGWRAAGYLLLKLPVAIFGLYALFYWTGGLVNLSFPFWWRSMRNHPPGVHLRPVPVFSPFGWFGQGTFHVATFPGTFAACAVGAGMVLAAPWMARGAASADRWLIGALLGPVTLRQRVRDLEQVRALAVDDSAARLRQVERDLHDGAQIRLATLAMNLGRAKKKLGRHGEVTDPAAVRDLIDAAHQGALDALSELRELVKGIHPPVLDNGLADALATLTACSVIPVDLTVSIPSRPSPAIETIAYFCVAELLANAAKHSRASKITIEAAGHDKVLVLRVSDDGTGGADPGRGTGLAGLAKRAAVVDGRLHLASPPGGPTRITVELPLRA